jgi:uncharacterized protein YndB with AHSA1/START domain
MENSFIIKLSHCYQASPQLVFDAWLDQQNVGQWLFSTKDGVMDKVYIDGRVGGAYMIAEKRGDHLARHYGKYLEIQRPNKLVFDFTYGADQESLTSIVTIDIEKTPKGCLLKFSHELDNQYNDLHEEIIKGWNGILDGLDQVLSPL